MSGTLPSASPDLAGRKARCVCGQVKPSSTALRRFEYQGPGSRYASEVCLCGHRLLEHHNGTHASSASLALRSCPEFRPRGDPGFDSFWCGCKARDEAVDATPRAATVDYESETILVVDDDPAVVRMCEQALKFHGYRVLVAYGPEEALLRSQAANVQVALIDIMMPKTNGVELARSLSLRNRDLKVIFMSGSTPTEISRLIGDYRHFGFIWKPFRLESLFHMIDNVVARSSASSA